MFLTAQGGFLGPFAWVFGKLFNFIYNLLANDAGIANLGLCIIIFTVIVKIIIFPLTFRQQKSSKINMFLQPEIAKIQKKYKDKKDQDSMLKQQREIQEIYDKYGTSMTNGCLPMLIQIPIIYALYRVIQNVPAYVSSIKNLYTPIAEGIMNAEGDNIGQFFTDFVDENKISAASYVLKRLTNLISSGVEIGVNNVIDVLSKLGVSHLQMLSDTLNLNLDQNIDQIEKVYSFVLGINISEAPGYRISWALLVPFASAFFQFLSVKISSSSQQQTDPASASMMKSMQIMAPIMSALVCITMPVYIGIYWAMSALITALTQILVNMYYDHVDMDVLLEKQIQKAEEKRKKRGGKKSFMERMMDQSQLQQEELQKQQAMHENSVRSLRNYVPSETARQALEEKKKKQYKSGSIGAKANIMLNYESYGNKEEKE